MADVLFSAHAKAKGKAIWRLTPERAAQEDYQAVVMKAGNLIARAIIAGQKLPKDAPEAPGELLFAFGRELGALLGEVYELGCEDTEGRRGREVTLE